MTGTQRYLLYLSYTGTQFRGSQIQNRCGVINVLPTVQGCIETALKHLLKLDGDRPIIVNLSSRTDSGVHAIKAGGHVDLPPRRNGEFHEVEKLKHYLNNHFRLYKWNLRILEACKVPDTFNCRKSVIDKEYLYRVCSLKKQFHNNPSFKYSRPIVESERAHIYGGLCDIDKAKEATELFVGVHDFGALSGKSRKRDVSTICDIKEFSVKEGKPLMPEIEPMSEYFDYFDFYCRGNRFLYHMVRKMVSVALAVGSNYLTLNDVKLLFEKPVQSSWNTKASVIPAHGLYLLRVNFKPEDLIMTEDNKEKEKSVNNTNEVSEKNSES